MHKLGHFGICTTDFTQAFRFFTDNFNLAPSDVCGTNVLFLSALVDFSSRQLVHDEHGQVLATFLHLDRGQEMVDHHCFFFYQGPQAHVHHTSYEVHDFDTQALGHNWLEEQGHCICWVSEDMSLEARYLIIG